MPDSYAIDGIRYGICPNKITGRVVDAATNQPLQGATITDLQKNLHRVTDINGNFSLPKNWKIHPLQGNLKDYESLTVKENWRIIFKFDGRNASDKDYIDYH